MIKPEQIFPCILILLDLCAVVPCLIKQDYWMACYWLFAGALNFTVTFRR